MYHEISTYQYRSTPAPSSAQNNKCFLFKAYRFSFALINHCLKFCILPAFLSLLFIRVLEIKMSSNRRSSAVWQYFQEIKEGKKSNWICVICKTVATSATTSDNAG